VQWQGFSAAKKVADLAESYELNIAPHNYNGPTLSNVPELEPVRVGLQRAVMESDPEQTPYRDECSRAAGDLRRPHEDSDSAGLGHRAEREGRQEVRVTG